MAKRDFLMGIIVALMLVMVFHTVTNSNSAIADDAASNGIIAFTPTADGYFLVIDTEQKTLAYYELKNKKEILLKATRKFDLDMSIPRSFTSKRGLTYKEVEDQLGKASKKNK